MTAEPGYVAPGVGPIVDQEDDQGVLGDPQFIERLEELADVLIDVLDHCTDACFLVEILLRFQPGALVLREPGVREINFLVVVVQLPWHVVERAVRSIGREVGEERLAFGYFGLHPIDRGIKVDVCAVALRRDRFAVVVQDRVGVLALAPDRIGGLPDPASEMHQRFFESLVHGAHRIAVAQVPLAEDPSGIARALHDLGDRGLVRVHHGAADECVEGASALRMASGHQRGARRCAHAVDVEVRESRATAGHCVEMGSAQDGIAVEAEVSVALIVGHDQDDVWWLDQLPGRGRSATRAQRDEDGQGAVPATAQAAGSETASWDCDLHGCEGVVWVKGGGPRREIRLTAILRPRVRRIFSTAEYRQLPAGRIVHTGTRTWQRHFPPPIRELGPDSTRPTRTISP